MRLISILSLMFSMLVLNSASQENVAQVVKRSSDAVVLIVTSDANGQETALGSGFLVSSDGEIVTNFHVIKGAHSAVVKLSTGAFFPVSGVLASDSDRDLAVIKVNGKNLPALTLDNDDKLQVGEHVVAIGSPLGLEGTVSDGVISSFRDLDGKKWIQTTAPVSHGNSGGPLLNMNDEVVGIITAGVNPEAGQNLNFAIPSNDATALLLTGSHQLRPLGGEIEKSTGALTQGVIWTSMTTGRDYNLRQDGDYLYVNVINLPPEAAGGFMRDELKKSPDGKWRGQVHARLPCRYKQGFQIITNWCSRNADIEIDLLSERRIEGVAESYDKFNCRKCSSDGKVEQRPFVWIPK